MAPDSLGAALARRARDLAAPHAANYAAGNRIYTVTVTRPAGRPTFNRATAKMQILPGEPLYTDVEARITPLGTDGPIEVFDELTYLSRAQISIDAGGPAPRIGDMVEVTGAPAEAAGIVGRVLRVDGITFGGHFPVGWLLSCTGIEPSPATQEEPQ